ncbi:MAG: hypothetical protein QXR31_06255 [Zestosphaera sp.]
MKRMCQEQDTVKIEYVTTVKLYIYNNPTGLSYEVSYDVMGTTEIENKQVKIEHGKSIYVLKPDEIIKQLEESIEESKRYIENKVHEMLKIYKSVKEFSESHGYNFKLSVVYPHNK